jgi:hypothetical protein
MMNACRFISPVLSLVLALAANPSYAKQEPESVIWQSTVEIAGGHGEKGPWKQNDSRYDYVDDPAVAIDDQGNKVIAWVDQKRKDVLFRRIGADEKQGALNLSRSPNTFSWLPRIVFAPNDPKNVYIIWQEIIFSGASHGGEIFFARSGNNGKSFEEPVNVSHSTGGDGKGRINKEVWHNGSFDLTVGPDGGIHVAWTEYDGMLWIVHSNDGGKSFSEPRQVAGSNDKPARGPSIAADGKGWIYLAWTTGENNAADILVARSDDKGASFSAAQVVGASQSYSDAPKLALDSKDGLHLAYAESDGGAFGNYHIRYVRSFDGARSFEAPRIISASIPAHGAGAAFPSLAIGAGETVFLTWELYAKTDQRPQGLGFVVSRDGGTTFSRPALVPGSVDPSGARNGSHQGLLMKKLAVGKNGAIAVVNSSMKLGSHSRVWLMHGQLVK